NAYEYTASDTTRRSSKLVSTLPTSPWQHDAASGNQSACSYTASDRYRLYTTVAVNQVDHSTGQNTGRKHGGDDAERQSHGEAFHRAGTDAKQNQRHN